MKIAVELKKFNLVEWYFSLTPKDKEMFAKYCPQNYKGESSAQRKVFHVDTPASFLWVTGANLIPHGAYLLGEKCLLKAFELNPTIEDTAHINANLAQLYYDRWEISQENMDSFGYENTRYQYLCKHYCNKTIETGYFVTWAENMLKTLDLTSLEWV